VRACWTNGEERDALLGGGGGASLRRFPAFASSPCAKGATPRLNIVGWEAILPVVLYGCETWCLTLREEHRLRVFENRVLRRILDRRD
jgi:hypothetical protein